MLNVSYHRFNYTDFKEFNKSFEKVFKKKISFRFYKWRYLKNRRFNSFIAKVNKEIIAHIGFVEYETNEENKNILYSRHSSFVLEKYRRNKIYSSLLIWSLKQLQRNEGILIWPNSTNLKVNRSLPYTIMKFGIYSKYEKKIILNNNTNNKNNKKIFRNIKHIKSHFDIEYKNSSIINKNSIYFNWRFNNYNKNIYKIFNEKIDNNNNMFILSKNFENNLIKFSILDFIGDFNNFELVLSNLIYKLRNYFKTNLPVHIELWDKKKLNRKKMEFYKKNKFYISKKDYNIFIINPSKKIIKTFHKYKFFMGDTDVFININKNN